MDVRVLCLECMNDITIRHKLDIGEVVRAAFLRSGTRKKKTHSCASCTLSYERSIGHLNSLNIGQLLRHQQRWCRLRAGFRCGLGSRDERQSQCEHIEGVIGYDTDYNIPMRRCTGQERDAAAQHVTRRNITSLRLDAGSDEWMSASTRRSAAAAPLLAQARRSAQRAQAPPLDRSGRPPSAGADPPDRPPRYSAGRVPLRSSPPARPPWCRALLGRWPRPGGATDFARRSALGLRGSGALAHAAGPVPRAGAPRWCPALAGTAVHPRPHACVSWACNGCSAWTTEDGSQRIRCPVGAEWDGRANL